MKPPTTALLALTLLACPLATSRADDIAARLAEYMEAAVAADGFTGSVLVARGDETLLRRGYGLANIEHDIANAPETKFRLGSITKQFTATAILMLQERGKLAVADPISRHLPDTPDTWKDVTIRHLLTHTSGIPSYTSDPEYRAKMTMPVTHESMVARFRDKPLEFEPGSKFRYDNSGYYLLGMIIEKASGRTYEEFLRESLFGPLGMADTGYDHPETVLPRRASGYERRDGRRINAPYLDMGQPYAAGSLYSTVDDLRIWHNALQAGRVLTEESRAAMFQPFRDGYAYGWAIGEDSGRKTVGHGGGINGFVTNLLRYPDQDVCVVVLCNAAEGNPGKLSRDLAHIAFGETVVLPRARKEVAVAADVLDRYVGRYEVAPNVVLAITRRAGQMVARMADQPEIEIYAESPTEFFLKIVDATLTFVVEDGKVAHLILKQNGRETKAMRLAEPSKP